MHAEDFVVNQGCNWHAVEDVLEFFPYSNRVSSFALVVETIYLRDLSTLMVASNQSYSLWIAHFEGNQQQKCFNRVRPSVDKVAHEKIICVRALTTHLEQFLQVVELSMNVTTNLIYQIIVSKWVLSKKSKFPRRQI